jgi:cobalt-zinc-cadmium efflux system membrane fusion protein
MAIVGCSKAPATAPVNEAATREESPAAKKDETMAAISPEIAKASGIELLTAGPATIRESLTFYGTIKANAEREQTVRARYSGVVRSVTKRPGDRVARGETLLTIESNDSLEPYSIQAPMSGTVLERNVNPGEAIDGTTALMRIADLTTVWAEFSVFARDLGRVRGGMPVGVRAGDSDAVSVGKISYVAASGHSDSQTVVARATLNNADARWVAGQFVTGEVVISEVRAVVAVKPTALQNLKNGPAVFVQAGNVFDARPVKLGRRDRDAIEILSGVMAGDRYAGQNSYLIKADLLKADVEQE